MFNQKKLTSLITVGLALTLNNLIASPSVSQTENAPKTLSEKILDMERRLEQEFETYFDRDLAEVTQTPEQMAQTLARVGEETQTNPAILWVIPRDTHLHLVLLTANGEPIVKDLYNVPLDILLNTSYRFISTITNPRRPNRSEYSQILHQWIIEPFEEEYLNPQGIDTILFCLGNGIRGLPLAALSDGEQFLIEKYSLANIPAFNLINHQYKNIQQGQILAMGAEEFENQNPLPAVPLELSDIVSTLLPPRYSQSYEDSEQNIFLNDDFTLANLRENLNQNSFEIVHLATHANFNSGNNDDSYIQFWREQLPLDQFHYLNWGNPPVELLVLSACRTALGDDQAELGFAGLALNSGVKSVLGSLWYVSDTGTLALMSEFYRQLKTAPSKAEALRQTQIKMLRGEIEVTGDRLVLSRGGINLPENMINMGETNFSHPYYWASFTLISSPW